MMWTWTDRMEGGEPRIVIRLHEVVSPEAVLDKTSVVELTPTDVRRMSQTIAMRSDSRPSEVARLRDAAQVVVDDLQTGTAYESAKRLRAVLGDCEPDCCEHDWQPVGLDSWRCARCRATKTAIV